jgi:hypothetical protein
MGHRFFWSLLVLAVVRHADDFAIQFYQNNWGNVGAQ